MHSATGLVSSVQNRLAGRRQFVLAQRLADRYPARGEEGVGHAAADDQMLDLSDKVLKHIEFRGNLGPTDNGTHRAHRGT